MGIRHITITSGRGKRKRVTELLPVRVGDGVTFVTVEVEKKGQVMVSSSEEEEDDHGG